MQWSTINTTTTEKDEAYNSPIFCTMSTPSHNEKNGSNQSSIVMSKRKSDKIFVKMGVF